MTYGSCKKISCKPPSRRRQWRYDMAAKVHRRLGVKGDVSAHPQVAHEILAEASKKKDAAPFKPTKEELEKKEKAKTDMQSFMGSFPDLVWPSPWLVVTSAPLCTAAYLDSDDEESGKEDKSPGEWALRSQKSSGGPVKCLLTVDQEDAAEPEVAAPREPVMLAGRWLMPDWAHAPDENKQAPGPPLCLLQVRTGRAG
jgi:hypothetical protein